MFALVLIADAAVASSEVLLQGWWIWPLGIVLTALCAALTFAAVQLARTFGIQGEASLKALLLSQLSEFAASVAARLSATMKAEYARLTADGDLSRDDVKQLADAALKDLKALLTEDGLARLQKVFGWGLVEVDLKLKGVLEQKITETALTTGSLKQLHKELAVHQ